MHLPQWIQERINQLGDEVHGRALTGTETALARTVFADSVPYERVAITNLDLGNPVTLVDKGTDGKGPIYTISWADGSRRR